MFCNKNVGMVHAARTKHPGKFEVDVRAAKDHKAELAAHDIASHGVVCLDDKGATLWKHGDHQLSQADLDEGVRAVLEALR